MRTANQFLEVFLNHQSYALRRGEFETVKIAYSCVIFVIKNEIFLIFQAKNLQKPYKGCRRYEMRKSFEDLTIADDYMFCKIMEHESLCRPFLEMLFTVNIGKITYLSSQNGVITNSAAKTVRLDILVKDDAGTSYDIEMSFSDRHPCLSENTSFAL